ncbi:MAG: hypothetical protein IJ789_07295 [Bacteroidales bacterium]|nr:hypothetical protein [Bacteroidales bacterium]
MTKLLIFNPEHDLCLANGSPSYVPPHSAVSFARTSLGLMNTLYRDGIATSAYQSLPSADTYSSIIAWGWNATLKHQLLKLGVPQAFLPTDGELSTIRRLQHRSTVLSLQPDCIAAHSVGEVEAFLAEVAPHAVMKAPWSGAGRGLHWASLPLTPQDRAWVAKTVSAQQCVIVEPQRKVWHNLALEYVGGRFCGYSLFEVEKAVYSQNISLNDNEIEKIFANTDLQAVRRKVENWLAVNIFPLYSGPLGVDLMVEQCGRVFVAEINLRHTMGMVAHCRINNLHLS